MGISNLHRNSAACIVSMPIARCTYLWTRRVSTHRTWSAFCENSNRPFPFPSENRLHNLLARVFPELVDFAPQITSSWVLTLLSKYPTPRKIAGAHIATLTRIRYASDQKMNAIHQAAKSSIASPSSEKDWKNC